MIPQKNRFSKKNFEFFRRKMKTFRAGNFLFFYMEKHKRLEKFAAVISKKTGLNAVERNRFRRKTYALFQQYLQDSKTKYHIILLFQKPIKIKEKELEQSIKKLQEFLRSKNEKNRKKEH